ncbi:nucleoside 2-deoxyribosyltransferase (plasmid) [Burkholderia sp. M6-3]
MASVADLRGAGDPDGGIAFEIGFAAALGKPVWAYQQDVTEWHERVPRSAAQLGHVCERGYWLRISGFPLT